MGIKPLALRHIGSSFSQPRVGFLGALNAHTTNLAGVWSVSRRLLTSYTGPLIRVRRSSDNAEQDIGYVSGGRLDTAALTTFTGAGNGFVRTVYSQVGSVNFGQATAGLQPTIVSSGTVQTNNGQPAMLMVNASNTRLTATGALSARAWIATAKQATSTAYPGLLTGISLVMLGDSTAANMYPPNVAGYVARVNSVATLSPFGFSTACFTVTSTSSYNETWLWGTERNKAGQSLNGPVTELLIYSAIPTLAPIEAVLMNHLGLP